jgi:prepilin-type N-terminal cleavage/methylation domain-containing protein
MSTTKRSASVRSKGGLASFTLIELLVVIAIIAILAALTLSAASAVMNKGRRSRAASEIQAMSTGLEGYKTDNGIYPPGDGSLLLTNTPYSSVDGTSTAFQSNSTILFMALSGQTNFITIPLAGTKSYMTFKANQVGSPSATYSYVQDPWLNSYAYSTGTPAGAATTNYPYNGSGFFDLWSTAGVTKAQVTTTPSLTNAWISNWQ